MRSLRARLVLGTALVAVFPLAVTMFFMSRQMQNTIRTQAAERLEATMGGLQRQLLMEGEQLVARIHLVATEPTLKRLYLVRPEEGQDLSEWVSDQRFLLGLDFLVVVDDQGKVVAEGSATPSTWTREPAKMWRAPALNRGTTLGLSIVPLESEPAVLMTAGSAIRYQNRTAGFVHGGMVIDSAFLARLKRTTGVDLALRDAGGDWIASTVPLEVENTTHGRGEWVSRHFEVGDGSAPGATLTGIVSTLPAERTINALRATAATLGLTGLAIAIVLGILWSRQVSRPVEQLASFSERIARGEWDEPLALRSVREIETLGAALERMRLDLKVYRGKLVASERQAAWSHMARVVAHEVKNPLTPIAVAIADLRRSYQQRRPDFPEILDQATRIIGEEVESLKALLQEFSDFARLPAPVFAPCRLDALIADLQALYGREVASGRLNLSANGRDTQATIDRAQVRQVLINLIANAFEATGEQGQVKVEVYADKASLAIAVSDTGPGMTPEQGARIFTPNFTTKTGGGGLGLTVVERIVGDHRGTIEVETAPGRGTTFRIHLPLNNEA